MAVLTPLLILMLLGMVRVKVITAVKVIRVNPIVPIVAGSTILSNVMPMALSVTGVVNLITGRNGVDLPQSPSFLPPNLNFLPKTSRIMTMTLIIKAEKLSLKCILTINIIVVTYIAFNVMV